MTPFLPNLSAHPFQASYDEVSCGAGWDSFYDAFQEILAASPFPLFMVVDGLQGLLARSLHLALATVMRLYEASSAFSAAGVQFEVLYAGDSWR